MKKLKISKKESDLHYFPSLDILFNKTLSFSSIMIIILLFAIMISLIVYSFPSIKHFGFSFFYGKVWDPYMEEYGALPFILGTLITSFLALIICIPFSIAIAIFLGEYFTKGTAYALLKSAIELLAGVPSIIYGFWGLLILAPVIQTIEIRLGVAPYGVGIFTSSIILSIMIVPYSASIGREVIALVPQDLKEAAYSLGATRFEVLRRIIIPFSRSGIFAGILLSLGRALGETMAVTMVIGNSNYIPKGIFDPANTMASLIANEFAEATGELYLSSLIHIGLWLFVITAIINIIGKLIIKKFGATS
ncbi:MAG: phosphate ABC transporter permease subunit PstC [Candidatus Fischerbacteria bacterium RBG_13_37_8]|uniref:Phosphate transport system permease protein n=1 Tax=Candidatus Fischerbacteria bacterium RBG_13_37_8 TaxID=1817863 RepID=A0A1F5VXQ3_9BACT|nr:MAG: phosphate ABC transporter permease subunit PstC [Candidatus Fischerbacteria bacterium RBG_13_37_8]